MATRRQVPTETVVSRIILFRCFQETCSDDMEPHLGIETVAINYRHPPHPCIKGTNEFNDFIGALCDREGSHFHQYIVC